MSEVKPYGSWRSPITSDLIISATIGLGQIATDGEDIYWLESRPQEGGRNVIVQRRADGQIIDDITPMPFNVRTRVHEYGGGDFTVYQGTIYFVNFADQRIYKQTLGNPPQPLTSAGNLRYADLIVDKLRDRLICVCEDHRQQEREPINSIIGFDLNYEENPKLLISGNDFYASPRLNPDGSQLAWLTWNHPNMPWDGTELWVANLDKSGTISEVTQVAGGSEESIFQPEWSPDGILYFVSDRTGWWNLYRWEAEIVPLYPLDAEFGKPQWVFGMSTYAFINSQEVVCTYTQSGVWYLAKLHLPTRELYTLPTSYTEIAYVRAGGRSVAFWGGSPTQPNTISRLDLNSLEIEVLRRASEITIDPGYLSIPQSIAFPTENGLTAYGFFYSPSNKDYQGLPNELPPLIVRSHGGPTAATSSSFNLGIQYWTSRGFAVLDVNYGGSSGYGRDYRQRLNKAWGIVDVDDCVNGAKYLSEQRLVDPERLSIKGGSAGGYTTLCALTFRNVFKAGASHYGVSDLEALAQDTHKFESRYLDNLIGAYPAEKHIYQQRSPIHFTEQLSCPVIFFQGLEDRVVPPNQAEMMVEAIAAKHLPVAYVPFVGEQHGFRRAENIKRTLDGELYFYAKVFGFNLADPVEPVVIRNLN